jgi:mannitol-specific phosphotransferase system IIBC component
MMLGGVVILLAVTFVPAVLRAWTGNNDQPGCTGEFTMLVNNFADLAVGILGALVVFTTVLAMIVYINLATKTGIDLENRMAASRELCFTAACLVQWVSFRPLFRS